MLARPRKRFGQHFLHDPQVLARIVGAVDPQPGQRLVEIGPGRGALTEHLLQRTAVLTAVEIDRDLVAELGRRFSPERLQVQCADALQVNFTELRGDGPKLRLIGNLPYNISTPLLFHLIEHRAAIEDLHFMLQKEVVDRMAAAPGSKIYGRLTVALAPWLQVQPLFAVGPGAFRPPPKVSSVVVRLTPWTTPPFTIADRQRFDMLLRQAFSQRRKTLRNALKGIVDPQVMAEMGIDPAARPERLTPAQFAELANVQA